MYAQGIRPNPRGAKIKLDNIISMNESLYIFLRQISYKLCGGLLLYPVINSAQFFIHNYESIYLFYKGKPINATFLYRIKFAKLESLPPNESVVQQEWNPKWGSREKRGKRNPQTS